MSSARVACTAPQSLEGVDFTKTVIESLECKVRHARNYSGGAHNAVVSML
jgi:hypothetical protein